MFQRFADGSAAARASRRAPWTVTEGAGGKCQLRSRPCLAAAFAEAQNRALHPILALIRDQGSGIGYRKGTV